MFCQSPSVIPTHTPGTDGPSRAPHLCVSLVMHSASNFAGSAYYVMQALNMWTDDFLSVGTRTTGTEPGNFLIAGPTWKGTAPADIKETYRCSTRFAWVLIQTMANGPADFPAVIAIENAYKLTPLSAWGKSYTPPENVPVDPSMDTQTTPFDQMQRMDAGTFFKRLALLMHDNPPYAADAPILAKLKKLGVEPGKEFDRSTVDAGVVKGLNGVPLEVWKKFAEGVYEAPTVNGGMNPLNLGRFDTNYNTRALVAWLGLGALTADDAVYPSAFVDGEEKVL